VKESVAAVESKREILSSVSMGYDGGKRVRKNEGTASGETSKIVCTSRLER